MLPISLTLRNFLSYRDAAPTLQLEDVRVACLCGPNGNGKSALLDAVTWALWGRARGMRDELLHHGQDDMFVELVFDAGLARSRYRVTRRFSRARRNAQSSLELHAQAAPGDFSPITGDRIAQTQEQIDRLIGMDYETFVNSAFLQQGRADAFSRATPANRKEVLGKVLGLGLYDRLEERAKAHARDLRGDVSARSFALERLRERAAQAGETRAALEKAEGELAAADAVVGGLSERLERLRERTAALERRKDDAAELEGRGRRAAEQRAQAESEADGLARRVAQWRAVVERADEIEAGSAALGRARERQRELAAGAQELAALLGELAPHEQAVASALTALRRDAGAQRAHIEELQARADGLPSLIEGLAAVERRSGELAEASEEAARKESRARQLALDLQSRREQMARTQADGELARERLALLDHSHADGGTCPLCNSELGPDGVARIRTAYEGEIAGLREQYARQKRESGELEQQAGSAEREASDAQASVEAERSRLDGEQARLEARKEEAERAAAQRESRAAELAAVEARIAAGDYALDEQAAARSLRARIDALAYDADAAEQADREVAALSRWEAEQQGLATARARLPDDETSLQGARRRASDAAEEGERVEQALAAIAAELAELPSYAAQRDEVARELAEQGRERDALRDRRGSLAQQLAESEQAAREASALERDLKAATDEAGAYGELALAFGKGGVQALLIEAAIPRLEDEANELLGRMTDGRMSLKLQTQRARRTGASEGEAVETLDVFIADELGTRPYELFSGGERFRVDFALRIALSKLLAWRAGAPLPTLFIDEGFGTQDAEGRDRILDVVRAIEDRFERILVITHMDDIKEAFPVRIEVTKGASGSTFTIT